MRLPRFSIGARLFLLTGGLMLAALTLMSAATFAVTRRVALAAASERLAGVTRDLADMLGRGVTPERLDSMARLGQLDQVRRAFHGGANRALPDTLRRLLAGSRQIEAVELLDADLGRLVLAGRELPGLDSAAARRLRAAAVAQGAGVGELRVVGDSVTYPTIVAAGERARPSGYVVLWRRLSTSPQATRGVRQLVGAGAGLHFGNARGDVWTDLTGIVPGPRAGAVATSRLTEYDRAGVGRVLGRARAIPGTPWLVLIEFPRSVVLGPWRSFMAIFFVVATLLALAGGLAAWLLGRRISVPLLAVTRAAETIAAGDPSVRVQSAREDEIGRLASAFNTMADRVARSRADLEEAAEKLRRLNAELEDRVIQRTEQLQAANRELEAFSYSVSHDLRAPLRAVDGFSRIVLEEHGAAVGPEGRRLLDVIRANTRRMGHLIDDLLAFSKMGRQLLSRSRVDLTSLAQEVVLEARAGAPGRALEVDIAPLGANWGDRAMLRHVFANLVENAVKFTRTAAAARITIGCERRQGETVYYVRDNGVGFDPRYADQLFGVFQRLHRSEEFEGTGVGLAIVQRIVHRHGGRVWAEGKVGGGATFFFTLPHEEAAA